MSKYLSKSDFQIASSCAKKLVYKKGLYPTANDTNEYMKILSQGGYIVGKMATLLFPNGIEIEGNTHKCIQQTNELMKKENVVLFEPAFVSGQKLIRVDILEKKGDVIHLIEVKAKSHNTEDDSSKQTAIPKKYIEDVAYQYLVLKESFPDHSIKASLLMPDKSKRTGIEELAGWFSIRKKEKHTDEELEELPAQQKPLFNKPEVVFKYEYNPDRENFINQLNQEGILEYKNVTANVEAIQSDILQRANQFIRILNEGISASDFELSKKCKACEFNTPDATKNGFQECWEGNAYLDHHIFDLYYGGSIGHHTKGFYLDELIAKRKASLFDIEPEKLKNSKGVIGSMGKRQNIQIQNTKNNTEWTSPELNSIVNTLRYPLHFIDFETYTGALPYHKGMRPYEVIAFQWSCHTINQPGDTPVHSEWIHTGKMFPDSIAFPNFEFAKTLMAQIGNTGTPLMWATHENTVLRAILEQMEIFGYDNKDLREWLINITSDKDREGRFIDMNKMTKEHYFHPYMKGRTSIKKVLPAVWIHHNYLHQIDHFKKYVPDEFLNGIVDPYDTLKSNIKEDELDDDVVNEGTAAMRAYQRIRFDDTLTTTQKEELRSQLLEYCKLDTMAMVIIAHHWGIK